MRLPNRGDRVVLCRDKFCLLAEGMIATVAVCVLPSDVYVRLIMGGSVSEDVYPLRSVKDEQGCGYGGQ